MPPQVECGQFGQEGNRRGDLCDFKDIFVPYRSATAGAQAVKGVPTSPHPPLLFSYLPLYLGPPTISSTSPQILNGHLMFTSPEMLSSPRARRAGPKGLRVESARAVTGRRNSHSGRGEDFLSRQQNFFTETAVTPERKVEKWFPRWEINRHAEG